MEVSLMREMLSEEAEVFSTSISLPLLLSCSRSLRKFIVSGVVAHRPWDSIGLCLISKTQE